MSNKCKLVQKISLREFLVLNPVFVYVNVLNFVLVKLWSYKTYSSALCFSKNYSFNFSKIKKDKSLKMIIIISKTPFRNNINCFHTNQTICKASVPGNKNVFINTKLLNWSYKTSSSALGRFEKLLLAISGKIKKSKQIILREKIYNA